MISSLFGGPSNPDPNAESTSKTSMMSGAAIGTMFAPGVGTGIGAMAGMLLSNTGSSQMRARRKATKSAYTYGQDAFSYLGQGREQVEETYQSKVSQTRARMGGSGASLEGSGWEGAKGELLRERDEALAGLDKEEAEFRSSKSYEWFKEDFDLLTDIRMSRYGGREGTRHFTVGSGKGYGRSGQSLFTDEQRGQLRSLSFKGSNSGNAERAMFKEYAARIRPDIGEYEKYTFGTDAQKADFSSMMDARIAEANTWYDRQLKASTITAANKESFYGGGK